MNRRQMLRMTGLASLGVLAGCARPWPEQTDATAKSAAPVAPREGRTPAEPQQGTDDPPEPEPAAPDRGPAPEAEPEPTVPRARVEVICRDALGLAAPVAAGPLHRLDRVTLHHTGVELGVNRHAPARLRGHQRYHLDQGWPDIAYHYAVDLRGNVYELRDPSQAGDTFTAYDPTGHLLVVCEGNYDVQQPSEMLLDGLASLLAATADAHGVDPATLSGHRDHASGLTCPGDALQARLPDLRHAAVTQRADGRGALAVVGGEVARMRVASIEAGGHGEQNT